MLTYSILVAEQEGHLHSPGPRQQMCTAASGTTFPRCFSKEELTSVKGAKRVQYASFQEQEGYTFLMRHISAAKSAGHCLVIKLKH